MYICMHTYQNLNVAFTSIEIHAYSPNRQKLFVPKYIHHTDAVSCLDTYATVKVLMLRQDIARVDTAPSRTPSDQ